MPYSLRPHELQHARLSCLSPSPRLTSQTHVHRVGDAIQLSHPLPPTSPLALNLSSIRVFSNESALWIRWLKYWSFNFRISSSSEYSGLISFRIDCFDLLAVQGTLKSFPQHHNSKASILWCSTFFMAQLSHLYMTIGQHSFDYTELGQQTDVSAF